MNHPKRRKRQRANIRPPERVRCRGHLQWVRGHVCSIEDKEAHVCSGKIQAAHVRTGTNGGMAIKPGDNWILPLCLEAHDLQHAIGETSFEKRFGIDMKEIAATLWARSPHRRKYEAAA